MKKLIELQDFLLHQAEQNHPLNDAEIENYVDKFIKSGKPLHELPNDFQNQINEGLLGSVIGGLTGLALGKAVGSFLIKVFKINQESVLYKLFNSRLFFVAVGSALGNSGSSNLQI